MPLPDAGVTQRAQRAGAYITAAGTSSAQGGSAGRVAHGQSGASNYAHAQLPLFQPLPESQPVLPCLLRRLLQQVMLCSRDPALACWITIQNPQLWFSTVSIQ